MKADNIEVKELLKLRTPQEVFNEIQKLETKKSGLRRSLCNYKNQQHPEQVLLLENQLEEVKRELRPLYTELQEIRAAISQEARKEPVKPQSYQYTPEEIKAITGFNNDKRFSITE